MLHGIAGVRFAVSMSYGSVPRRAVSSAVRRAHGRAADTAPRGPQATRARVRACVQLESDRTAQLRKLADEFSHLEKSKERSATRMRQARAAGKRLPHARVVCRTRT
jgi:hypothetical protein